ncbi:NAAT family transporter [Oceanospirillaceae bacterium]|jgi:multiple antibiotic resistance protein|nr:NAAT family transporter [Oceanospirillaceae bacterium]MDA9044238.1 NAAT family transporter [bacterium]MBT4998087.1 NAAT family transporter [Oceanospirillaceae bacterium]MBT5629960.1 NAAT family transporter [Oceanospirillaceae bacterium]MBT6100003.1 NAAT family transporter [Oceanospirillaceae bacterium]|tara:strand:+ start:334 stop:924 length:591 start_codon:yes stop_codon:yes gene_type:complete
MDIFAAATLLFLVMDPLGNIPLFLSVLKQVPEERRRLVLRRELLIAYLVLLIFLVLGPYILSFLQVSQEAIRIGGGIVLFLIAIKMVFPKEGGLLGKTPDGEPFIVPLAIPLMAGPSSLAMIMLMRKSAEGQWLDMWLAVTAAWVVSALILLASRRLYVLLGERGLIAIERLMGMVLIIMAVQMLLEGTAEYLNLA